MLGWPLSGVVVGHLRRNTVVGHLRRNIGVVAGTTSNDQSVNGPYVACAIDMIVIV